MLATAVNRCLWEGIPTIFLALIVHVTLVCWFVEAVGSLGQPKTSRTKLILRFCYYFAGPRPADSELFDFVLISFFLSFWFCLLFYGLEPVAWVRTILKYSLVFTIISTATYLRTNL
jgi:hypothetical protein